jgi:ankyrin repeat protein
MVNVDCDNNTALHNICMQLNAPIDVIKFLIEMGGKDVCRIRNKKGETALHLYCRVKCPVIEVVEDFVSAGGKEVLNAMDMNEVSLLHILL